MVGKGDVPMPWKKTCVMDERLLFIADCLRGELPMSVVCEQFGISRKTGYKWLERYRADPEAGLLDRARRGHVRGRLARRLLRRLWRCAIGGRRGVRASCGRCWSAIIRKWSGQRPAPLAICCAGKA
jgi:hypothetical protein